MAVATTAALALGAGMSGALAAGAASAAILGTGYSIDRQRAAAQDQKRASRIEQRKARIQNARERRRAAAQAQVARSQVQAQEAAGGFSTTGQSQQVSAINSQLAGNLSFSRQIERMNQGIINAGISASGNQTLAAYGQAAANLPGQLGFDLGSSLKSFISNPGISTTTPGQSTFRQGVSSPSNFGSVGGIA